MVKQIIELSQVETTTPTQFVGFDRLEAPAKILEVVGIKDKIAVILDNSPFYAEMGGQVGDTGEMSGGGELWTVVNTQKAGDAWLHFLADKDAPAAGTQVQLSVDRPRREAIQRHHTVTHLLHWALHEVVSPDATQKGSYVAAEKLTFDFGSAPLTPQQVADVERLVNERILENAPVTWTEAKFADIKSRKEIMQFFGEKYGDVVRVVQVGGKAAAFDGYSMELCGGTHTHATGEIGLFRIAAESAIAAGIRRIEAVSGLEAYRRANEELQLIKAVAGKVNSPVGELEKKIESLLAQQKDLEKQLKAMQQKQAVDIARGLAAKAQTIGTTPAILENLGAADGDFLQSIADALKGQFKGVVVLGGTANGAVALVATVAPELTKKVQAGKIIQTIAPIVGGKGGGRPDNARGGGKDVTKLDEALAKAKALLG
jgi:alanyl-tRNA synthetase